MKKEFDTKVKQFTEIQSIKEILELETRNLKNNVQKYETEITFLKETNLQQQSFLNGTYSNNLVIFN